MKALLVCPKKAPEIIEIENKYEKVRSVVCNDDDGLIEVIYPWDDPVALVCDEEGKIKGYEANRVLEDKDGNVYDILVGNFLIVGIEGSEFASLSDELVDKYANKFQWPEYFYRAANHLFVCTQKAGANARAICEC